MKTTLDDSIGCFEVVFIDNVAYKIDEFVDQIQTYLSECNVISVTNLFPFKSKCNYFSLVYILSDGKKISIPLLNSRLRDISDIFMNKYLSDRYNCFMNNDVSYLVLDFNNNTYSYDIKDNEAIITLKTDINGNVLMAERDFIKEFLNYKFLQYGKKVNLIEVKSRERSKAIENYIIECENIRVMFPWNFGFTFMIGIVNEYNDNILKNIKYRIKTVRNGGK